MNEKQSSPSGYPWGERHIKHLWLGGTRPVDGETYVRVWLRGTRNAPEATSLDGYASIFDWGHSSDEFDITGYMVLVEAP